MTGIINGLAARARGPQDAVATELKTVCDWELTPSTHPAQRVIHRWVCDIGPSHTMCGLITPLTPSFQLLPIFSFLVFT